MCIEGFRMEEACGRAGPLPPCLGFGAPGTGVAGVRVRGVPAVPGVPADSCSYPCREQSAQSVQSSPAGSPLIDSVPDAARGERTPPDLSPRGRDRDADLSSPPAHAAGVLADMEAADTADSHPADSHPADSHPVDGNPVVGHPVGVPLVGRQPTPETIAARVRLMQKLAARTAAAKKTAPSTVPEHELDLLARVTAQFSVLLHRLGDALETAQRSHYYSVLSRTTQPAHLVAFVAVALVAASLFPRSAESTTATSGARGAAPSEPSPWTYLAYVVAFAAHFGSQFWMTFVSGLSLFFSLPRHHFGAVQKVLFPLYFAINAALSLVTLSTFVRLQPPASRWDAEVVVQVGGMVLCFLLELLVRLYLTPPLLHLITAKTEMEKTVEGVGEEVGRYDLGPLTQCPHYVRIHRAFRKVHVTIAMANIAAMACTALHAHYLAGKICV